MNVTVRLGWFALMGGSIPAHAAVTTTDRLRASAEARVSVAESTQLTATQHYRTSLNGPSLLQVIPNVEVSHAVGKWVSVAMGGRVTFEHEEESSRRLWRAYGDAELSSPRMGAVGLKYRTRVQRSSTAEQEADLRWRNRWLARFSTGTVWTPEVFYEHFLDPNGGETRASQKYRWGGGVALRLARPHRLKLRWFADNEVDGDGDTVRISSVAYQYRF